MFEEWDSVIAKSSPSDAIREYELYLSEQSAPLNDAVPVLVDTILAARDAYRSRLRATELARWLDAQAGYQRAKEILARARARRLSSQQQTRDYLIEEILRDPATVRQQISGWARWTIGSTWDERFVESLRKYLYQDHEAVYRAKRDFHRLYESARIGIEGLAPLFGPNTDLPTHRWINTAVEQLNRAARIYGSGPTPRNSKLKAEHAFVEDMWRVHMSLYRARKAEVIAELMTLPCFQHSFDLRHVARLCEALQTAKAARSAQKLA